MKFTKDEIRRGMTLYAVTDRTWLGDRTLEQVVEEVLRGGATFLQLREKELTGEALLSLARRVKEVTPQQREEIIARTARDYRLYASWYTEPER